MLDEVDEERVFTLSEARSLIPKLRRLLARVTSERESLVSMRVEIDRAREKAQMGGGSQLGPTYLAHMIRFSEAVQEIEYLGVHVKDFRTGLVDFPYEREGRIVYLCWKPDEDEIGWWHETDSGFVGRQPLTEDFD
ncbi:MAG TPA: DUF2203 domain-containing protein [Blastocatellia bacterium]|jgi:hypothetical protein|nr:DUF2203 domain-containing protein [Blastocatellia bacterium]